MNIPPAYKGTKPCLSVAKLRTYGAGGFRMWEGADEHPGCPRQYRARYVDYRVPPQEPNAYLAYGRTIHKALELMEERAIGPEEALQDAWEPGVTLERFDEAKTDLNRYLERGGPMTRFGSLRTEAWLETLLYTDEEYGPLYFGGYIDRIDIDVNDPGTIQIVDHKAGFTMPKREEVERDIQLMAYHFLVQRNWAELGMTGSPSIVCHLDLIKWRSIEVKFSDHQIDVWQEWVTAIGRRILRDEAGDPVVNPGCAWCPIKHDCRAYRKLPGRGLGLLERQVVTDIDKLVGWKAEAERVVKALNAGIAETKAIVAEHVRMNGPTPLGGAMWLIETGWENEVDRQALVELIGIDEYMRLANVTKTALDRWASNHPEHRDAVKALITRVPSGEKLKTEPIKEAE